MKTTKLIESAITTSAFNNGLIIENLEKTDKKAIPEIVDIYLQASYSEKQENLCDYFMEQAELSTEEMQKVTQEKLLKGIELYIQNKIFAGKDECLIARDSRTREILGVITHHANEVEEDSEEEEENNSLHIELLAIKKTARGKGIAPYLIGSVVALAKMQNRNSVNACTIGDSFLYWKNQFYGENKVYSLLNMQFDQYIKYTCSRKPADLFSFLNDKIENPEVNKFKNDIVEFINKKGNVKFLEAIHIVERNKSNQILENDDNDSLKIQDALALIIREARPELNIEQVANNKETENNIEETSPLFQLILFILFWAKENCSLPLEKLIKDTLTALRRVGIENNDFNIIDTLKKYLRNNDHIKKSNDSESESSEEEESSEAVIEIQPMINVMAQVSSMPTGAVQQGDRYYPQQSIFNLRNMLMPNQPPSSIFLQNQKPASAASSQIPKRSLVGFVPKTTEEEDYFVNSLLANSDEEPVSKKQKL